ncbi:hypothetical protein P3342_009544 [Pyrenophora teres f. teres]|nr:hypothetical protein P3342_009544 [Pyrenophora teres f. teres]
MNPHQQNKVDISKMSEQEAKLFRLYGKLPNKKDLLQNKLKERKYFDSGDYALSKAGKAGDVGVTQVGREHPNPEKIPHIAPHTYRTKRQRQRPCQRHHQRSGRGCRQPGQGTHLLAPRDQPEPRDIGFRFREQRRASGNRGRCGQGIADILVLLSSICASISFALIWRNLG